MKNIKPIIFTCSAIIVMILGIIYTNFAVNIDYILKEYGMCLTSFTVNEVVQILIYLLFFGAVSIKLHKVGQSFKTK